tara:strand:- start:30558 stop:30851 length:294 start_codon:yes stop_codon:yes gene_type:complete
VKILILSWALLLPTLSWSASLQEQISTIKSSCGDGSDLLVKKILISILKDEKFKLGTGCSDNLTFLVNQCSSGINCQGLINLYQNKLDKKSGSVIGE